MKTIEKLAREICWVGFQTKRKDVTKAAYWKSLPVTTRKEYEFEAVRFIYLLEKIPIDLLNDCHLEPHQGTVRSIFRTISNVTAAALVQR